MRPEDGRPRGILDELNLVVWPVVFGLAGWHLGDLVGVARAGAMVGAIPGLGVGYVMARAAFHDVEVLAAAGVASVWFLAAPRLAPWFYLALCTLPLLRLALARAAAAEDEAHD